MKHNYRNRLGQFAATPTTPATIVAGRLYGYKGIGVRAIAKTQGQVIVSFHKTLIGRVDPDELTLLPKSEVDKYLATA